ncbi:hypothetical protein R1flu_002051 [Riccia fluitans]|uniref:Uncharacterized protein n=1 Tax=Riccia fluitans TaxID=41844 RepID=A0ABD1Y505_9MARC
MVDGYPRRKVSSMSFVRICLVTMTILRLFLCMCWRARVKERLERRETTPQEGTDKEQACGSLIESQSRKCTSSRLKYEFMHGSFITIKKQILVVSAIPKVIRVRKLGPTAGNLSPEQVLVNSKSRQVWEDERFHQLLRRWLRRMWRKRKFYQREDVNLNGLQTAGRHQVVVNQIASTGKEISKSETTERQTSSSAIAWAESSESYDLETPCCSFTHEEDVEDPEEERISNRQGFPQLEQTLKAILDDFLTKDDAGTFNHNEGMGDACSSPLFLPNQIVGLDHTYRATSPDLSLTSGIECEKVYHLYSTTEIIENEHKMSVALTSHYVVSTDAVETADI